MWIFSIKRIISNFPPLYIVKWMVVSILEGIMNSNFFWKKKSLLTCPHFWNFYNSHKSWYKIWSHNRVTSFKIHSKLNFWVKTPLMIFTLWNVSFVKFPETLIQCQTYLAVFSVQWNSNFKISYGWEKFYNFSINSIIVKIP